MALTKVTGSVIKDSVSLSGNVSIGGTLTYQDVTNVDALGIGTFRAGIDITGGNLTIPDKIIHSGDTNTSLRFPSADTITAETGGAERLRIGINGGVGIGTDYLSGNATVYHKLMVVGDTTSTIAVANIVRKNSSAANDSYTLQVDSSAHTSNMTSGGAMSVDVNSGRAFTINGNGNVGVGTNNPNVALHILSNTTGLKVQRDNQFFSVNPNYSGQSHCAFEFTNALSIRTGSGAQNERLRIDSNGKLLVGHTADIGNIRTQFNQNNQFIGATGAGIKIGSYANNAYASSLEFIKSRSATLGTNTLIQNGDTLGTIMWGAADGANYQPAAYVSAVIEGSPNTNDIPTRLSFGTAKNGAAGAGEKMRINPAGQIMIGDSTVGNSTNSKLVIQGMVTNDNFEASIALRRGSTISTSDAGLGYIRFQDSAGDTGAFIGGRADSSWSGSSHPTHLWFATVKSGSTSLTEACRITSGGYLQQHNLPIASYSDTRQISLTNTDLTGSNFYNYLWYTSDSNLFDSSTGHFIAPVHGIYRLYFRCTTDNVSGNRANVRLRKNGNTRNEAYASNQAGSTNIQSVSSEIVDVLNAGEYFDIQVAQLHTQSGNQHKQVTFHMLG